MNLSQIVDILGDKAEYLLDYKSTTFDPNLFAFPQKGGLSDSFKNTHRNPQVIQNLEKLYNHGRLGGSGYLSILPVDQGVEHSAGASFATNPEYFDPKNLVNLAIDSGCSGFVSTFGAIQSLDKSYASKIPLIVKLNHNELLSYPNQFQEQMFTTAKQAKEIGAIGVGATIYFGSPTSNLEIQAVRQAFSEAHELGMFTVLWCYVRNSNFKIDGVNYETSADLTGQANHLGVSLGADIIKQKLPTCNGGFKALNSGNSSYGKLDEKIYTKLATDHPIDLTRYQIASCYMGKVPMISSGGDSGSDDLKEAVISAVINKRAGGSGLIMGRKAFKKPFDEGVKILQVVQDVYLCDEIGLA